MTPMTHFHFYREFSELTGKELSTIRAAILLGKEALSVLCVSCSVSAKGATHRCPGRPDGPARPPELGCADKTGSKENRTDLHLLEEHVSLLKTTKPLSVQQQSKAQVLTKEGRCHTSQLRVGPALGHPVQPSPIPSLHTSCHCTLAQNSSRRGHWTHCGSSCF